MARARVVSLSARCWWATRACSKAMIALAIRRPTMAFSPLPAGSTPGLCPILSPRKAWWARRSTCSATRSPASTSSACDTPAHAGPRRRSCKRLLYATSRVRACLNVYAWSGKSRVSYRKLAACRCARPRDAAPPRTGSAMAWTSEKGTSMPITAAACRRPIRLGRQAVNARRQHGLHGGGDLNGGQGLCEPVGPAHAGQHTGLRQRAHTLLQEKGIARGALDQEPRERHQARVVPQQGLQEAPRRSRAGAAQAAGACNRPRCPSRAGTPVDSSPAAGGWPWGDARPDAGAARGFRYQSSASPQKPGAAAGPGSRGAPPA